MLHYANLSFILHSIQKLLTYHTPFAELSTLKQVRFLAHPVDG